MRDVPPRIHDSREVVSHWTANGIEHTVGIVSGVRSGELSRESGILILKMACPQASRKEIEVLFPAEPWWRRLLLFCFPGSR